MKNIFVYLKWIPEFYFILAAILWFYDSAQNQDPSYQSFINFPAVVMIVLFHIQLFLNDHLFGKILATTATFASVYLILSYTYNVVDFNNFDYSAQIMTLKLGNFALVNLIMSVLMFIKYRNPSVETEAEMVNNN